MIRVHVICEGQTEEEFVRHVLSSSLLQQDVILLASCIGKVGHKGGNVNLHTAPSKRIQKLFPAYDKPEHPLLAAMDIGLEIIRQECPLFDAWVNRLEKLKSTGE
jgi:hypothetical protein